MTRHINKKAALTVLALLCATATLAKDEPKWAAGVQLRSTHYPFPDIAGGSNRHSATGLNFTVSRDFGRYFSLEFGYEKLGQASQSDGASRRGAAELRGAFVDGALLAPIATDWTLVARLGWMSPGMRSQGSLAEFKSGSCCGAEITFGTLRLGVGMRWNLSADWQLRADVVNYSTSDRTALGKPTSVGLAIAKRF